MADLARVFDLLPKVFDLPYEVVEALEVLAEMELTVGEFEAVLEAVVRAETRRNMDVADLIRLYEQLGKEA